MKLIKKILCCSLMAVLVLQFAFSGSTVNAASTTLKVFYINVGKADAILINQGDDYMLLDTGTETNYTTLKDFLKRKGVTKLKYVIISHYDSDHCGGLKKLCADKDFTVEKVVSRKYSDGTVGRLGTLDARFGLRYQERYNTVSTMKSGDNWVTKCYNGCTLTFGNSKLTFYNKSTTYIPGDISSWTGDTGKATYQGHMNNDSLVFKLTYGNGSFFFGGDTAIAGQKYLEDNYKSGELKSDVYKVNHHGYDASNKSAFINLVKPSMAVVTQNQDIKLNDNCQSTLDNLRAIKTKLYSTYNINSYVASTMNKKAYIGILISYTGSKYSKYGVYKVGDDSASDKSCLGTEMVSSENY